MEDILKKFKERLAGKISDNLFIKNSVIGDSIMKDLEADLEAFAAELKSGNPGPEPEALSKDKNDGTGRVHIEMIGPSGRRVHPNAIQHAQKLK